MLRRVGSRRANTQDGWRGHRTGRGGIVKGIGVSIDIKRLIRTKKLGKQHSSSLLVSLVLLALHLV